LQIVQKVKEEMMSRKMSRRDFMKIVTAGAGGVVLASCAPKTVEQVVKETQIVKETQLVPQEVIKEVTPTPKPTPTQEAVADVLGTFPRRETVLVRQLTGRVGTPDNMNLWVGWKWQDRGLQNLADEPLWSVDFATGNIINGLADGDARYNADFTECTVPLRTGVTWNDGEAFTADDVVYTVETIMKNTGFNSNSKFVDGISSVTAVDGATVKFVLTKPNSRFHTWFLDRWGCDRIMPKHIFEKQPDPVQFTFNPYVGCGPYKLNSFDPQGFWTAWERREDWINSPTGMMYGQPVPKYIVIQAFDAEGSQILAQLTHELDVSETSADGLKALLAQSKTVRGYQPTFPFVVNNDPCITGILFNTARAPFDNLDVRWALILSINMVEYMSIAVDSTATVSPVHVPHLGPYPKDYIEPMQDWLKSFTIDVGNGETFAVYDPDVPKRVAADAKSRGYVFPDTPEFQEQAFGLGWYKYAPDIATKLLEKNGFKADKDKDGKPTKWYLPDGKPWTINYLCGNILTNHDARNAQAAVQQWKKFGIDANVLSIADNDGIRPPATLI
jgi:peptide/nickel transport system substrate-binding protein